MRWKRGRGRDQIEDRRGQSPSGGFGGGLGGILGRGGGFPLPAGRGGLSIGAVVVVLIVLAVLWFTGAFGGSDQGASNGVAPGVSGAPDPDADLVDFVGFVVDDVQDFWRADFRTDGRTYQTTKIVLFTGQTQSGCGMASSETGPFYCPVDRKVYLDLGFFRELASQFEAPGDFAQAYVIAHEFGHHVQTLLGTEDRVREESQRTRATRTSCQCGWSCRPTATPACGGTTRTRRRNWIPGTSTRGSGRRPRWETTASSARRGSG